jgi:replicative DNA helicase
MGNAEIIIAKHRHGSIGTVPVKFDGGRTKFSDAGPADDDPGII